MAPVAIKAVQCAEKEYSFPYNDHFPDHIKFPDFFSWDQSREWVDGSWVMGQMGHENRMGHMGHGSLGVDP